MKILHTLKTSEHTIPVRLKKFSTVHEIYRNTVTHTGFLVRLDVEAEEGKYAGHQFGLLLEPGDEMTLDHWIEALGKMKERLVGEKLPEEAQ